MDEDSPLARARENATSIVSTLVTGIWLAALFTDQEWWLAAMLVGYVVVIPITAMLFGPDEEDEHEAASERRSERPTDAMPAPWEGGEEGADEETALDRLRRRYAEGELTDEQFERKLERLLETETLEDVEDREWARERTPDPDDASDAPADDDREPEPERS